MNLRPKPSQGSALAGGSDAAGLFFAASALSVGGSSTPVLPLGIPRARTTAAANSNCRGPLPPAAHDGGAGKTSRCSVKAEMDAPAAGPPSGRSNVKSIGSRRLFHAGTIARPSSNRTTKPTRNLQRTEAA